MLSRSSVLFYWDAAFGPNPVVGGDPVFVRDSAGSIVDRAGVLRSLIRGSPRTEWVTINGITRPAMLLEMARTNRATASRTLESPWVNSSVTTTLLQPDAHGGIGATSANATVAGGSRHLPLTLVGDGTKTMTWILKKDLNFNVTRIGLHDSTASLWRHLVAILWSAAGVPALTTDAGAGVLLGYRELTNRFYEIKFNVPSVVAANANAAHFYPGSTGTGITIFDSLQVEDGSNATAIIDTAGAAASRAVEQFYCKNPPPPQDTIAYGQLIYGRDTPDGDLYRFWVGSGAGTAPYWGVRHSNGNAIFLNLHNGTTSVAFGTASLDAVQGDVIEYAALIKGDQTARIIAARNFGSALVNGSSASVTLPGAWSDQRLWLNSSGLFNVGASQYTRLMMLKPADMSNNPFSGDKDLVLSELRNFMLGPAGLVI